MTEISTAQQATTKLDPSDHPRGAHGDREQGMTGRQRAALLLLKNIWLREETFGDDWVDIWAELRSISQGVAL